jgi:hypothetical protein
MPCAARASDVTAARSAATGDPEYSAGYLSSWDSPKTSRTDAARGLDACDDRYVTREELMKLEQRLLDQVNRHENATAGPADTAVDSGSY